MFILGNILFKSTITYIIKIFILIEYEYKITLVQKIITLYFLVVIHYICNSNTKNYDIHESNVFTKKNKLENIKRK